MKRVVVGLSGGVDSSVAAALLIEQGYEVIGVFMKNWHDTEYTISNECPWEEDSKDALLVAEKLNIPFQTLDLSETYKTRIVDYMFREYESGRTPNPDVLCNREIKFDVFLEAALSLGADYVATGHYCQKSEVEVDGKPVYQLKAGADKNKDQSYFLCQVNQQQLSKALFPIGHLQKSEVRKIAEEKDLITAGKKDSQGLCFIGKVRLPDFLQQQLKPKPGNIVEIASESPVYANGRVKEFEPITYHENDGQVVGQHQGAHFYTIGQRKGLGVGGKTEPLFVLATDVETNSIYVGMGDHHPGLNRSGLFIDSNELHWVRNDLALAPGEEMTCLCRIRYRQPLQEATLRMSEEGLYISFKTAQKAIAAGQFAAWYLNDELIGSGVISA
ncbi:MAG: tRNA 2-thiouridine(34) synthase MnmA [Bacteroidia bacterium]|nr:tRNA 2-thiouridine(34) synthase MnmA [Bacteroidia bacterium]